MSATDATIQADAATQQKKTRTNYSRNFIQENGVQCLSSVAFRGNEVAAVANVVDAFNKFVPFDAEVTKQPIRGFFVNFPWRTADNKQVWEEMKKLRFFDHLSVVDPKELEKPEDKRKAPVEPEDEPALVMMPVPGMHLGKAIRLMKTWGIPEENITCQHTLDYAKSYFHLRSGSKSALRIAYDPLDPQVDFANGNDAASETKSESDTASETASEPASELEEGEVQSEQEMSVADSEAESDAEASGSDNEDAASGRKKKRGGASVKRRDQIEFVGAHIPPSGRNALFRTSAMYLLVGYRGENCNALFHKKAQSSMPVSTSSADVTQENVSFWKKLQEVHVPGDLRQIIRDGLASSVKVLELFNSSEEALSEGPFDLIGNGCPGIFYPTCERKKDKPASDLTSLLFQTIVGRYTESILEMLKSDVHRILSPRVDENERTKAKDRLFSILTGLPVEESSLQVYLDSIPKWKELYEPLFGINAEEIAKTDRFGFYKCLQCALDIASTSGRVLKRAPSSLNKLVNEHKKKNSKSTGRQSSPSGIMNPYPISQFLAQFLGRLLNDEALANAEAPAFAYSQVTSKVPEYLKAENLKYVNEEDSKTYFRINEALSYLMNYPVGASVRYSDLCSLYAEHYPKEATAQTRAFLNLTGEKPTVFLREVMEEVNEYIKANNLATEITEAGEPVYKLDTTLRMLFQETERTEVTWSELRQMYKRLIVCKEKKEKQPRKVKAKQVLASRQIARVPHETVLDETAAAEKAAAKKKRVRKPKAEGDAAAEAGAEKKQTKRRRKADVQAEVATA